MMLAWNLVTKHVTPHDQLQQKFRQKISKLEQHLQHFPPDAVHLLVHLERHAKRGDFTVGLALRLPSNILHSHKSAPDPVTAFDRAVKALLRELAAFKAALRRENRWERVARGADARGGKPLRFAESPQPAGPQSLADVLGQMIRRYHGRLLYHVQRQLWRDQLNGDVPKGAIDARAVVDEVARQALAAPDRKPDDLSYRFWLHTLAKRELKRRYRELRRQADETVPIHETSRLQDESPEAAGYDAEAPLEIIEEKLEPPLAPLADLLPDARAERPDEAAMEHDMVDYLHRLAESWPARERAVFDLHFLEGFDEDELAMLENVDVATARQLIAGVQSRLRSVLLEATEQVVRAQAEPRRDGFPSRRLAFSRPRRAGSLIKGPL